MPNAANSDLSPVLSRLETGRPLLLGSDSTSSFRARGVALVGPAATARLVRESPTVVAEHYHQEIGAGVDVLGALTSETVPRVLAEIGMSFRAAALTSCAVDLALDAAELASRPVAVAGVLGATSPRSASGVFLTGTGSVPPPAAPPADKLAEEYATQAARLAAAGCELILARGVRADINKSIARLSRRAAVVSASATELPTWAVVELEPTGFTPDGETLEDAARSAIDAGAHVVVFELAAIDFALPLADRMAAANHDRPFGVVAGDRGELGHDAEDAWARGAKRLLDAGALIVGGGHGTTCRHIAALTASLRSGHASMWPQAL